LRQIKHALVARRYRCLFGFLRGFLPNHHTTAFNNRFWHSRTSC
jgi:hypothetical protein